jgi:hypothetical protein
VRSLPATLTITLYVSAETERLRLPLNPPPPLVRLTGSSTLGSQFIPCIPETALGFELHAFVGYAVNKEFFLKICIRDLINHKVGQKLQNLIIRNSTIRENNLSLKISI